jgi:channel protein (hemolysin III family)
MIKRTVSTAAQVRPLMEKIASSLIQGGAAVASVVALVYLVTRAWRQQHAPGPAAIVVYGASMFVAFLISALYHGVQHARIKCSIAGTACRSVPSCGTFVWLPAAPHISSKLPLFADAIVRRGRDRDHPPRPAPARAIGSDHALHRADHVMRGH